MSRKKIDDRIRTLIDNGVQTRHRSLFVVVGDAGREQVANLHYMQSKAQVARRPSVLWCYKDELSLSSNKGKRSKQLKKQKKMGLLEAERIEEDPFALFLNSTDITYAYYDESDRVLGQTFGMCVLQDFEALTPNLLARTVETVQGGGLIVILLQTLTSLKQLSTMAMDVHARYRSEGKSNQVPVARFNERFLLSLPGCDTCLVVTDKLDVIPVSSSTMARSITPLRTEQIEGIRTQAQIELDSLKKELKLGHSSNPLKFELVSLARTLDQAKVLQSIIDTLNSTSHSTFRTTYALTAARGRGKSAALGLCLAAAIASGFGSIFVTAPRPENVKTLFEFVFRGLDALGYREHLDYEIIQATAEEMRGCIVRVNIHKVASESAQDEIKRSHRQTIMYVHPQDAALISQAELLVIDEAAAIPLPYVQSLTATAQVTFLASTVNGYEGTGRSLSLKLIQQLREKGSGVSLTELSLSEPIRYALGDPVESWLHRLLCLDACLTIKPLETTSAHINKLKFPNPEECELYAVNRDTLFSFHKASETFLHRMMGLYVASHYKNTPNDLQLMSDAPAHRLYVLLPPVDEHTVTTLPDILCVVQVAFEGSIAKGVVMASLARGKRAGGDLIPWTMAQQFQDDEFTTLSGARIVRVAVHPDLQGMGYGSRAIRCLQKFFTGRLYTPAMNENENDHDEDEDSELRLISDSTRSETLNEDENVILRPRKNLKPLLVRLSDRKPVLLDWLGVSFGMTATLHVFWRRLGMLPVYLRQTSNETTGEHTAIMLQRLDSSQSDAHWLTAFHRDFCRRFSNLLGYQFRTYPTSLSLDIIKITDGDSPVEVRGKEEEKKKLCTVVINDISLYDLKRLESYANNMVDYHLIMDLVPTIARHYFLGLLNRLNEGNEGGNSVSLSPVQAAVLLGMGLQNRIVDSISSEIGLPVSQVLAMFIKSVRKFARLYRHLHISNLSTVAESDQFNIAAPIDTSLAEELESSFNNTDTNSLTNSKFEVDNIETGKSGIEKRSKISMKQRELIETLNLAEYEIPKDGANEEEWNAELGAKGRAVLEGIPTYLNITKSTKKKENSNVSIDRPLSKAIYQSLDGEIKRKAKKSKYSKQ